MTGSETAALVDSVQTWRYKVDSRQHGFFLVKKCRSSAPNSGNIAQIDAKAPNTPAALGPILDFTWGIGSLSDYENGFFYQIAEEDRFIGFADPSTYPIYPGWMLRNLLILIRRRWKLKKIRILCYRDTQARRDDAKSIIIPIEVAPHTTSDTSASDISDMPRITGWERNGAGKVMSKVANLGEFMDPNR